MDKIFLKNVEIFAKHGVFQEEKTLGQKFILDIELSLDTKEAGVTGDLTKSVHYGELCHRIEEIFTKESYDLIETAAQHSLKNEAYLSIGSNIGDKQSNLKDAIERLSLLNEIKVEKVSEFLVTEPWGYTDQEEFLNGAVKIKTTFSPKELVRALLNIESEMKRERIIKWGPRIIDLDVVFYDDLISDDEEIILPHPRMEEREFVLKPLSEICPYKIHPVLRKSIVKLLDELN
ncbi:2-amino-4-hydroxy-6-hydroxymethyldihydropteridine diphosphokinase [Clostridium sp. IBUN22A]|uniref:2-amino-4-hydroxy-6- hydroxymethyldihydropteridine diphosphokinase n=1 Tax=Clostridium sp. IBUN22A TaxID=1523155 RepID=UPI0005FB86D0|nr:2-amino-4-hydroxy-6-hydroxymethyldihydropteridine diphosphokinase [Clostridium sp. IBUN22A]